MDKQEIKPNRETCANCVYYQECLPEFQRTILAETERMEDCVCEMWKHGENTIQSSLFESEEEWNTNY